MFPTQPDRPPDRDSRPVEPVAAEASSHASHASPRRLTPGDRSVSTFEAELWPAPRLRVGRLPSRSTIVPAVSASRCSARSRDAAIGCVAVSPGAARDGVSLCAWPAPAPRSDRSTDPPPASRLRSASPEPSAIALWTRSTSSCPSGDRARAGSPCNSSSAVWSTWGEVRVSVTVLGTFPRSAIGA